MGVSSIEPAAVACGRTTTFTQAAGPVPNVRITLPSGDESGVRWRGEHSMELLQSNDFHAPALLTGPSAGENRVKAARVAVSQSTRGKS
jgi:hypothetical protein